MSGNWGKRVKVPMGHKEFSASYRLGHGDASRGFQKLPATYFSVQSREAAYAAYLAGYDHGKRDQLTTQIPQTQEAT